MLKQIVGIGLVVISASGVISVSAQQAEPTPEELAAQAADTRQSLFKLLRYNLNMISGMARGTVAFDAAVAERNANRIAELAPMIPELFAADTRAYNIETEALPIIWDRMDEFTEKANNLVNAANTFAATARGGERNAILGGIRAFGGACGNCHETFRED
ncbi:MAG: cytochrome c [Pseudomonadales bacterium]|nr:cytochrome c [Pseudomonadales bacterium]MCP5344565.1 cytochrome c [Pseudomonadales bacterium]